MNFKKYKKLEQQLREVEGEQKTKERMKYFYNVTKEMYQQQYHKLSCDLGVCLAEKSKLEQNIKNIVPELKKVNKIIDNLEFTLDLDKYIETNKLIKKPVKKAKFTKELLNNDIILSYLVNTIKIEDYLKIKDILLKEVKNEN